MRTTARLVCLVISLAVACDQGGSSLAVVGEGCAADEECESAECYRRPGSRAAAFCTTECDGQACPEGMVCGHADDDRSLCMRPCAPVDSQGDQGWACVDGVPTRCTELEAPSDWCYECGCPGAGEVCRSSEERSFCGPPAADGESCILDEECESGICMSCHGDMECIDDWC